ncbi:MAG: hypothetical protein AVDCRST_MAG26-2791, partial [uncultured Chloroflexia bacterium]
WTRGGRRPVQFGSHEPRFVIRCQCPWSLVVRRWSFVEKKEPAMALPA